MQTAACTYSLCLNVSPWVVYQPVHTTHLCAHRISRTLTYNHTIVETAQFRDTVANISLLSLPYPPQCKLVEDVFGHTNFEQVPVTWFDQDKRPNNPHHTETLNVSYLHIAYILVSNSTVIITCIYDTRLVYTHWIIQSHCITERTTGTALWCWDQSNRVLFLSGYVIFCETYLIWIDPHAVRCFQLPQEDKGLWDGWILEVSLQYFHLAN